MEKPAFLYRGICLNTTQFFNMNIFGDIKPASPPKKNEQGQDIVQDGNEYGIYMTTSYNMAQGVYGNVHQNGTIYSPEVVYNESANCYKLCNPQIGVTYKVDTSNIKIKKPWIVGYLQGHYNNGYEGEEWITDASNPPPFNEHRIPKESVTVTDIVIGYDMLNNKEKIDVANMTPEQIMLMVKNNLEKRTVGYDLFLEQVKKYPQNLRFIKIKPNMCTYKKLFNIKDGIAFHDYSNPNINNLTEVANYLMQKIYNKDRDNIDIESLKIIHKLSNTSHSIENFITRANEQIIEWKALLLRPNLNENYLKMINKKITLLDSAINYIETQIAIQNRESSC